MTGGGSPTVTVRSRTPEYVRVTTPVPAPAGFRGSTTRTLPSCGSCTTWSVGSGSDAVAVRRPSDTSTTTAVGAAFWYVTPARRTAEPTNGHSWLPPATPFSFRTGFRGAVAP